MTKAKGQQLASKRKRPRKKGRPNGWQPRPTKVEEDAIVRVVYTNAKDALDALGRYRLISGAPPRRLYRISFDCSALETIWLLANDPTELYFLIVKTYLRAKCTTERGPLDFKDPRPRLEMQLAMLGEQLKQQRAIYDELSKQQLSNESPRFAAFLSQLNAEMVMKERLINLKQELLAKLQDVKRSDMYYTYRLAKWHIGKVMRQVDAELKQSHPSFTAPAELLADDEEQTQGAPDEKIGSVEPTEGVTSS
jgi:hypothetical protein